MNIRDFRFSFVSSMLLAAAVGMADGSVANAGERDWPQWRGPQRDGYAAEQPLLKKWPEGGPVQVFENAEMGRGYSSVAIVDDHLFTMGADEQQCYAMCLDATDGNLLWKTNLSRAGTGNDYNTGWGAGPRSTPTVDGDQVFVLSDVGVIAALQKDTGKVLWSADLVSEHGGTIPKWGYSESVLIDDQRVVCSPGGDNYMIALDRQTGRKVWQSRDISTTAHYVSVMKGQIGSTNYYVTAASIGLFAFDCDSGNKLFETPVTGNNVATIPTPILTGNRIYHTSDYGAGNVLLELTSNGNQVDAQQIYHLDGKTMMNHHGGVILHDGVIYGFTKANGGTWMAQDLETGDTLWEEKLRGNKSGSIAMADGMLYCYNDGDGSVYLVRPNREKWDVAGKLVLPRQTKLPRDRGAIWAHPVIADQKLYLRDQDLLFSFDIRR